MHFASGLRPTSFRTAVLTAAVALAGALPAHALPIATAAKLQLTSGPVVGSGVAVTLTATVTANGAPVARGFVTFCDASAKYCEDLAVLGTAAVNSNGVATMKKVLPPGTHMVSAKFNATTADAASTSAVETVEVAAQLSGKVQPAVIITKAGTSNPLPVQASVSVGGTAPLTGTVSIVQDQGRQALVASPIGTSTVQGGFAPLMTTPASYAFTQGSLVGDFNGDGLPDLAAFVDDSSDKTSLQIYLDDSANPGRFLKGQTLNAFDGLLGDFNNDGVVDMVAALPSGDGVSGFYAFLPGDPNHPGQFLTANPVKLPKDTNGSIRFAADVNQDGVLDLIGTHDENNSGDTNSVIVVLGDPAHPGHFLEKTIYPFKTELRAVADMNGDGIPDLVGFAPDQSGIEVVLGDPAHPGQFLPPIDTPFLPPLLTLLVGDLNQDGYPDLLVVGPGSSAFSRGLSVMLNDPSSPGHFHPGGSYPTNTYYGLQALGDFNGDGLLDVAVVDSASTGLTVLPNDPANKGHFLAPESYPALVSSSDAATQISSVESGDFNGDGVVDLNLTRSGNGGEPASPVNILLSQVTQTASVSFPIVTYDATKSPLAQALYSGDDTYGMIGSCNIDLAGNAGKPVLSDIHADPSNTTAEVLWYWHGAVGAIDYGTTPALGSTTGFRTAEPTYLNGPSYLYLHDLAPGTKYYYQIRAIDYFSGCSHWTTTSPVQSFTTTP